MKPHPFIFLKIFVLVLGATQPSSAQNYVEDPSFQELTVKRDGGYVESFILQDGDKVIINGNVDYVNSVKKDLPIRLNADGSVDDSFHLPFYCEGCDMASREDGKIVWYTIESVNDGEIYVRLYLTDANGQLENTFLTSVKATNVVANKPLAIQSDNKMLVGSIVNMNGTYPGQVHRLHPDGSPDLSFTTGDLKILWLSQIFIQPDGKIWLTGSFELADGSPKQSVRLNSDGSFDSTFSSQYDKYSIRSIAFQKDGKVLFLLHDEIVRLHPSGEKDQTFLSAFYPVRSMALQSDGKIVIGCWKEDVSNNPGSGYGQVIRLNQDGSKDETFDSGVGTIGYPVTALTVTHTGQILTGGFFGPAEGNAQNSIVQLNAPDGKPNTSFQIKLTNRGHIEKAFLQKDGRLLVFGDFNVANEALRNDLTRLNQDGTTVESFQIGTGVDGFWDVNGGFIRAVSEQEDHKLLVGGYFSSFNGKASNSIVRLNENGSIDQSFSKYEDERFYVNAIAIQNDQKILVGGNGYPNGSKAKLLNRLLPDGTPDPDFTVVEGANSSVHSLLVNDDETILVAGNFTSYNNVSVNHIVRLKPDGSIDPSFNTTGINQVIRKMVLQPDGKVLILGEFTEVNNQLVNYLFRLQPDGSLDATFKPELGEFFQISDFGLKSDGQIFVCGSLFEGDKNLVLLESNGSLNKDFYLFDFRYYAYDEILLADDKLFLTSMNNLLQFIQQENALGITKNNTADFIKIYPNPASDFIMVKFLASEKNPIIHLFDVKGQRIPVIPTITPSGFVINTTGLSRGVYFLKLTCGNKIFHHKVLLK